MKSRPYTIIRRHDIFLSYTQAPGKTLTKDKFMYLKILLTQWDTIYFGSS